MFVTCPGCAAKLQLKRRPGRRAAACGAKVLRPLRSCRGRRRKARSPYAPPSPAPRPLRRPEPEEHEDDYEEARGPARSEASAEAPAEGLRRAGTPSCSGG